MSQIIKKFIGNDEVGGAKILLENDSALRSNNAAGTAVNLFKYDGNNKLLQMQTMIPDGSKDLGDSDNSFTNIYVTNVKKVQTIGNSAGNISIADGSDLLPAADDDQLLGSSSFRFKEAYLMAVKKCAAVGNDAGNLALSGGAVILAAASDVRIVPVSPGGGAPAVAVGLRFYDDADDNYVALKSPATLTVNTTYTLPSADGSSGQVLSTNGSGALSWVANPAAPTWFREAAKQINGSSNLSLTHAPIAASLIVFISGVMARYGVDYEVDATTSTQLNFNLPGAAPTISGADDIYIKYQYSA